MGMILPLAVIIPGSSPSSFAYAAPITPEPDFPSVANQTTASPYDGTYSGTFNYEYREKTPNKDYPVKSNAEYVYGKWTAVSLKVTVTFETRQNQTQQSAQLVGQWSVDITNVIVDDPAFGAGQGVTPVNDPKTSRGSSANLPYGTTATGSLTGAEASFISISFPNNAYLKTAGTEGNIKVSVADWVLSGDSWAGYTFQKGSPLSVEENEHSAGVHYLQYEVSFKNWNLKKLTDDTCVYDGTYSGLLAYEYRERAWKTKWTKADVDEETEPVGEWISDSFKLSVTFKTSPTPNGKVVSAKITRVACSDPIFETGAEGIPLASTASTVYLPPDPTKPDPWPNADKSQYPVGFGVKFSNEAMLKTGPKSGNPVASGMIRVSPDGRILYGDTWSARTLRGVLSEEMLKNAPFVVDMSQYERYEIRFKSWKLTKEPYTNQKAEEVQESASNVNNAIKIRRTGASEWVQYDGTGLKSGDEIEAGSTGKAIIQTPDNDALTMKPNSALTTREWVAGTNYSFELTSGGLHTQVEKSNRKFEIKTPTAVVAVHGTEFTIDVDADGATTVMVFDGAVSVTDITSKNGITLVMGQSATIPKTQAGLTQQDMLGRVKYAPPGSVDKWWEKTPASTASPTGEPPWRAVAIVFLAIAVIFLISGQVFAAQLKRKLRQKSRIH